MCCVYPFSVFEEKIVKLHRKCTYIFVYLFILLLHSIPIIKAILCVNECDIDIFDYHVVLNFSSFIATNKIRQSVSVELI